MSAREVNYLRDRFNTNQWGKIRTAFHKYGMRHATLLIKGYSNVMNEYYR